MTAKLRDVCSFTNGGTPSKAVARYFQGDIPWITGADIVGPRVRTARSFITREALENSAANRIAPGTILLVTRTSVGKVAIADVALSFSQDITAISPDPRRLFPGYLEHFLRTKRAFLERAARGATIRGITRDVVADLEIPLRTLEEQRRIADILDKADAVRAKRRASVAQLESLPALIFREMFGEPVSNPMGWPKVEFHKVFDRIGQWVESGMFGPTGITRRGGSPKAGLGLVVSIRSEREQGLAGGHPARPST